MQCPLFFTKWHKFLMVLFQDIIITKFGIVLCEGMEAYMCLLVQA